MYKGFLLTLALTIVVMSTSVTHAGPEQQYLVVEINPATCESTTTEGTSTAQGAVAGATIGAGSCGLGAVVFGVLASAAGPFGWGAAATVAVSCGVGGAAIGAGAASENPPRTIVIRERRYRVRLDNGKTVCTGKVYNVGDPYPE